MSEAVATVEPRDLAVADEPGRDLAPPQGPLLSAIVTLAKDPTVDTSKLQALLEMQERMEARQAEREFIAAFNRLSTDLPRVKKNGTITLIAKDGANKGSIPFARWEDVDKAIRPLMVREGFTLSFDSAPRPGEGGGLIVTGTLMHAAGHTRTASMPLALDTGPGRNNLQAMGSTLSYGKRYCAEMLLNIVREGEDDDGKLGGTKFISPQEAADLEKLIAQAGRKLDGFLQFWSIAALENLPADCLAPARNMLWSAIDKAMKPKDAKP